MCTVPAVVQNGDSVKTITRLISSRAQDLFSWRHWSPSLILALVIRALTILIRLRVFATWCSRGAALVETGESISVYSILQWVGLLWFLCFLNTLEGSIQTSPVCFEKVISKISDFYVRRAVSRYLFLRQPNWSSLRNPNLLEKLTKHECIIFSKPYKNTGRIDISL